MSIKTLNAFALLFVLTALPVSAQLGPDGTGVVNGCQLGPGANLSGANLTETIWNTPDPRIAELETQLAAATAERDTAIAERDDRPTVDQMQDARVGSIVLAKDWQTNAVSLCFGLQKTEDFVSWEAFEGGTWSDALDGEFKLTLPLGETKKWLRLTLPE